MRNILIFSIIGILSVLLVYLLVGCTGMRPKDIGVKNGKLKLCPDSPNCVNTQADPASSHYIDPIKYTENLQEVKNKIIRVIQAMPRTKIITETDNYIYAEYTTPLMRYVDDVEFYIDDTNKLIHFRSASRLGYSDMGLNRKRMEEFRSLFVREL